MAQIGRLSRSGTLGRPGRCAQVYWALGGVWGVWAVLGEGNPVPPPPVLWLAVIVPLAFSLLVLGRMEVWGGASYGCYW